MNLLKMYVQSVPDQALVDIVTNSKSKSAKVAKTFSKDFSTLTDFLNEDVTIIKETFTLLPLPLFMCVTE
jgi:hypothetical protein